MKRVLLVSVEPPWPAHHGGRIRTAKLAEALSRDLDVLVTFPDHGTRLTETPVATCALPWSGAPGLRTRASMRPHLGAHFLLTTATALAEVAQRFQPDAIYWSHSYLAAWSPESFRALPQIVEFANIESRRLRTLVAQARGLHKLARAAEAAKAPLWEPKVARRASLCVALSEPDLRVLTGWSAKAVLAPNGVDLLPYEPSPVDGYALALASYDYEPNIVALRRLVAEVWPLVRQAHPRAQLVVAGRRSESLAGELSNLPGVSVRGSLDDVVEIYANAALSLAPAATGGGSQLKLTESLSRGRSVVMTPFAAQGLPGALQGCGGYWVADGPHEFARSIVQGLTDVAGRRSREHAGWQRCGMLGWPQAIASLVEAIDMIEKPGGKL